jgi:hypothetical protein
MLKLLAGMFVPRQVLLFSVLLADNMSMCGALV